MNNIQVFNFNQNQVRTQTIDNEPYFCLVDARHALSIKGSLKVGTLSAKGVRKTPILTKGGKQELTFINEPNLYRLIFRSNKPQAQAFADWVYSEVLPTIRKTGSYSVNVDKPVLVQEHTRALPSGKKEIVLSEKARAEIGGIMKSCLGSVIRAEAEKLAQDMIYADKFKALVREAIREELHTDVEFSGNQNWKLTAHHAIDEISRQYDELKKGVNKLVTLAAE